MKQAFHIFKKDVRHLRYDIAVALLAAVAFCVIGAHSVQGPGPAAMFLPATWWFLIARVIHAEALPGNQQFWLTRPYRWQSLLGAKALFIFAFVNLPLLVADAVIIHTAGFSVWQQVAGLLWTQVLLIAAFALPAAAVSAITSGLAEFLIVTLFIIFLILGQIVVSSSIHSGFPWMELEWVKSYCLIAELAGAATIILIWQYKERNTSGTRMVAAVTPFILMFSAVSLPWSMGFALQNHLSRAIVKPPALRIELDSNRKWLGHIYPTEHDQMVAEIPLKISGFSPHEELKPNGLTITVRAFDGSTWNVDQPPPSLFDFKDGILLLRAVMGRNSYLRIKSETLQLSGTLFFTLYGDRQSSLIPLDSRPITVTGMGLCSAEERFLLCNSTFRPSPDLVTIQMTHDSSDTSEVRTENSFRLASYCPFPAEFNIYPLNQFFSYRMTRISGARINSRKPLAHLKQKYVIEGVRLNDFGVSR